jgi:hypothetical protein
MIRRNTGNLEFQNKIAEKQKTSSKNKDHLNEKRSRSLNCKYDVIRGQLNKKIMKVIKPKNFLFNNLKYEDTDLRFSDGISLKIQKRLFRHKSCSTKKCLKKLKNDKIDFKAVDDFVDFVLNDNNLTGTNNSSPNRLKKVKESFNCSDSFILNNFKNKKNFSKQNTNLSSIKIDEPELSDSGETELRFSQNSVHLESKKNIFSQNHENKILGNSDENVMEERLNEETPFNSFNFILPNISFDVYSQSTNHEEKSVNFSDISFEDMNQNLQFFDGRFDHFNFDNYQIMNEPENGLNSNLKPGLNNGIQKETLNNISNDLGMKSNIKKSDTQDNDQIPNLYSKVVSYVKSPFDQNDFNKNAEISCQFKLKTHFLNKSESSFLSSD